MKLHDYEFDKKYEKSVAYFSMEFALHQALKIYSGGLGFLAGSHMRSVYDLKQNVVGIGILWSYGYYNQSRDEDRNLKVEFIRKRYYFLEDLNIKVIVNINNKPVYVKAYLVPSNLFRSAPIILLSTDIDENDYISRTITHKLYDANEETRIAQEIILGIGGVRVLEALNHKPEIYHMNEGHSLPLVFELYSRLRDKQKVKELVRFTTHTPEAAGNETHDITQLARMGFFNYLELDEVKNLTGINESSFSLTIGALRMSKVANGVSQMHGQVSKFMWEPYGNICEILAITNAQNKNFWFDRGLARTLSKNNDEALVDRKKHLKRQLFNEVANQTGKMFDENVLTIVWARRFAEYKRPGLLKYDFERFENLVNRTDKKVQIIWAGKPYPFDSYAISLFNELIYISRKYKNVAVLIGYELDLSMKLKKGCDIWLNTPRITREASGTSGMSAAMNGAINFSIPDGWHPEFAVDGVNAFTITGANPALTTTEQDLNDNKVMMDTLENEIIPLYYNEPKKWLEMMKNSMNDVLNGFESGAMADKYYEMIYKY